jgi:RNA polymerase sigma factor (sigma-70 family)
VVDDPDGERFRALFTAHFRPIYGYALRRAATPELAADVAAETFTVAWRRLTDVPDGGQARLWLYGVAQRVLANTRRGERRRSLLVEKLGSLVVDQLAAAGGSAGDPVTSRVREALDSLPPNDREVLVLTAWEQLTPGEIGVVLGLPAATVRTRLHRARIRLRRRLSPPEPAIEPSPPNGHVTHSPNPTWIPDLEVRR